MRVLTALLFSLAILAAPLAALADCEHQGQTYPEGTRIGPYVCTNGEWVPG
jgi:hypothetical protein